MPNLLPDTFCVFILTHGRPDNVITYKTLQRCGYTGRLYLIVDNEDKTVDRYRLKLRGPRPVEEVERDFARLRAAYERVWARGM